MVLTQSAFYLHVLFVYIFCTVVGWRTHNFVVYVMTIKGYYSAYVVESSVSDESHSICKF